MANNAGGLPDECARLAGEAREIPEIGPGGEWLCAYTLGKPPPPHVETIPCSPRRRPRQRTRWPPASTT